MRSERLRKKSLGKKVSPCVALGTEIFLSLPLLVGASCSLPILFTSFRSFAYVVPSQSANRTSFFTCFSAFNFACLETSLQFPPPHLLPSFSFTFCCLVRPRSCSYERDVTTTTVVLSPLSFQTFLLAFFFFFLSFSRRLPAVDCSLPPLAEIPVFCCRGLMEPSRTESASPSTLLTALPLTSGSSVAQRLDLLFWVIF